jgi:hypothetical protein
MHLLGFTPEQIEENRRHHGGSLFLSENVAVACLFDGGVFGVGLSVCPTTGEMILSQVATWARSCRHTTTWSTKPMRNSTTLCTIQTM